MANGHDRLPTGSPHRGTTGSAAPGLVLAAAAVVVLGVVLVASVELDRGGVRGVVIGAGVGLVNVAVSYPLLRWAVRQGTATALRTVVGGFIARLIVVAGLMVLFQRTAAVDVTAFAVTFLAFFSVWLGLEVLLVERSLD